MKTPSQESAILERVSEKADEQARKILERIFGLGAVNTFAAVNRPGKPRVYVIAEPVLLNGVDALLAARKENHIRYWVFEEANSETFLSGTKK